MKKPFKCILSQLKLIKDLFFLVIEQFVTWNYNNINYHMKIVKNHMN